MTRASNNREMSDEVAARPLAAVWVGAPPPAFGGDQRA
jgi:hypothetical protein